MPEALQSILLGTIPVNTLLLVSVAIGLRRPVPGPDARDRILPVFLLTLAAQCLHFIEEFATGLHHRLPELLGLTPWSAEFLVSFNVAWIGIWVLAALGLRSGGGRVAMIPVWFLALAGVANGVLHPGAAVAVGGYFPGLITCPVVGGLGLVLLGRLMSSGPG